MPKNKQQDLGGATEAMGAAPVSPPEPTWIAVRMTATRTNPLAHGPRTLARDRVYLVDLNEPAIRRELQATWMVPLPANQQPEVTE